MPSERQLEDVAGILAVQAGALDRGYLQRWAKELGINGEIEKLLSGQTKPKNT